ncbi:aminomethyl-transferring glycine dehydrogenase [Luminiphilus sp.]|nr:aminomethyl-transferring glycine dehydrogenase [Luminiphilus sp.]MDB2316100.1 aminomethyl-transferring glycine dehydrogenase [Luminiphilus sp.]MDB2440133.1 aminomethyl-transferring glycine dehydrogenase [Luminiphilus sp.]MDB2660582.1 aminomethyl-transferring glycine dehydrogenase [Luminiphilus sp.]
MFDDTKNRFQNRHIGTTAAQQAEMATSVGFQSVDELIATAVPDNIKLDQPLTLPPALTENEALLKLRNYADQNKVVRSCIGMGYYDTITPPVLLRNVFENPGWYTAYTPYQPEISQGRLETLLTYQQMVIDLTGMPLANASLLDEATAAAEAMTLMHRMNRKSKSSTFVVTSDCHPQTISLIQTRAEPLNITVEIVPPECTADVDNAFGVLAQYPGTLGDVRDLSHAISTCHEKNILFGVATDLLALTVLKPPGAMGADVVLGSSQRFGVPMGYGGPHAAFFATREEFKRSLPGRVIGVSIDSKGRQALRMAMQTREQHIRREKATSNICTAQALLAIMAGLYAMHHGPDGLRAIGERVHAMTSSLAASLRRGGLKVLNESWFDTLCVEVDDAPAVLQRAADKGYNCRRISASCLGVSLDETTTTEDLATLANIFGVEPVSGASGIPDNLLRKMDYLSHPLFQDYRTETEMLRYLKRLENKDISLTRSMIPLGSCTMKLNAAAEMIPVSWPEFARMHPFAPAEQVKGYTAMLNELSQWLTECTGYDAMSLQPNSGAQGEYAGLMAIRRYHRARGEAHRNICLIPTSAHGTNPASAVMAGMKVVLVACDDNGNVDMHDLKEKTESHSEYLAAIMVTYPSTHGVFETSIVDLCDLIHEHGGQVYVDGANLNALVGLAGPGKFGADVSHLNLHKTFCIPHGGGGPGMGPIGVGAHLAPYLPSSVVVPQEGLDANNNVISATPFGSASILPISWMYIAMMGSDGVTEASRTAIVHANYIAQRLKGFFDVLYTGRQGTVAHECIIDIRPLKERSGITEEDVAKRLIDYGFHAPTMSFPVAGTLMIEPTESESLNEIDRFCDAMLAIREEIRSVEDGRFDPINNPLKNAPHTLDDVTASDWNRPYSREQAVWPVSSLRGDKYWAPVNRVDNVYGDRNLICSCPSIESYLEPA